jgi:hypothetical protein
VHICQASPELCRLRIVCGNLNAIVEAKLFSHIIIDIGLNGAETMAAQLEALSSGRASSYAHTLDIRSLKPLPEDDQLLISRIVNGSYEKQAAAAMMRVRRYLHGAIFIAEKCDNCRVSNPLTSTRVYHSLRPIVGKFHLVLMNDGPSIL